MMTRPELRVFLDERSCGCGSPEAVAGALLRLLRLHPMYEHLAEFAAWIPDEAVRDWLMYELDARDLTEHGGNVSGAWLSGKGQDVMEALAREEGDGFTALYAEHCVHGVDMTDLDHDCTKEPT